MSSPALLEARPPAAPAGRASAIYPSTVTHRRLGPVPHEFSYRVLTTLIDLDEVAELDRDGGPFRYNRSGLVAFLDRDHGPRDGSPLRPWIDGHLAAMGIDLDGGPVRILCSPRILGYVFNPLSVWFCHHRDGSLRGLLYEVRNTFGESHNYLIPVEPGPTPGAPIRQSCRKDFHVSPFMPMDVRYDFAVREPDERAAVTMRVTGPEGADRPNGPMFVAAWHGRRIEFTKANLRRALAANPLSTLKVTAGIHIEALRLWVKGAPFHRKPPAPGMDTRYVGMEAGASE
ncbi:MAG TPA: DUF1365 domain-containing protein [Actinomycetota bacterium]|nr:DUF1365 domain-containing protein [Actinomycetota bacterium]